MLHAHALIYPFTIADLTVASVTQQLEDLSLVASSLSSKKTTTTTVRDEEEGIYGKFTGEGADKLSFISEERLAKFEEWMKNNPVGLLRSPPSSGKTTLAQLLEGYLSNKGRRVVRISMLRLVGQERELEHADYFNEFWKERVKTTWTECSDCEAQTDIIIDEAQVLYDKVPFFWARLKSLMQADGRNPNLRVLLLSMYGDRCLLGIATPLDFPSTLGLDDLRLLRPEFDQVVNSFIDLQEPDLNFSIPLAARDAIFRATGGHAGLIRRTLKLLRDFYRDNRCPEAHMLNFLASSDYRNSIKSVRAFAWADRWEMTAYDEKFLRSAFYSCDSASTFRVDLDDRGFAESVAKFVRSGLVTHAGNNRMQFAAPLMRIVLGQRLFTAQLTITDKPRDTDFYAFLRLSIQRMRPSVLRKSMSHGSGADAALYERMWQMEWYRAASSAVPENVTISPDVGPVFGSSGFLDFYVNGAYQWGVELSREGQKMKDHAKRFAEHGAYTDIPLKQWAIIDFRHRTKTVSSFLPNFWHALYTDDFRTITLRCKDQEDIVLTLRDDEVFNDNSGPSSPLRISKT